MKKTMFAAFYIVFAALGTACSSCSDNPYLPDPDAIPAEPEITVSGPNMRVQILRSDEQLIQLMEHLQRARDKARSKSFELQSARQLAAQVNYFRA